MLETMGSRTGERHEHVRSIRVLLVDDHPIVRRGLRYVLRDEGHIEVVGEAEDGEEALARTLQLKPDVVVMDLTMPGLSGVEATRAVRAECPESRVLILTMHDDPETLREVLRAGASGYVTKGMVAEELALAISAVASGSFYVDPSMAGKLVQGVLEPSEEPPEASDEVRLSERETQVARMASLGHTNREIAETLDVSVKTVETYRTRLKEKLGLKNRADLVRYAISRGWLAEGN